MSGGGPLVVARPSAVPSWAGRVTGGRVQSEGGLRSEDLLGAPSVWIDGSLEQAIEVARAVYRKDPTIQVGIVAAPEDREVIERRILFTPGLGEVWLHDPEEVDEGLVSEAGQVTEQRRSFRATREKAREAMKDLRGLPARAIVTDAYLAALLQVLPDPVVSVDEDDVVVSWSAAAETMLGYRAGRALGRPLSEVVMAEPEGTLQELLEEARTRTTRRELRLLGAIPLIVDAVATPVEAGGVHVRALVLRDVTRERESLRQVEEAMAQRGRFFASMSHEIRTPINAILGYNDLLLSGALGEIDESHARHLERSQTAARHLLELVNDVLDLSKLEAGKIELQFQKVRSGEFMEELAATLEPLADKHGTRLVQQCEEPGIVLNTDPRRVRQILLNLVSNAVKFGEGRPVQLRCMQRGDRVRFEVQDEGRGIDPEDLDRIFEEFTQVGGGEGGTGLGLSISRRLAEVLGGTVTVESEPGVGSTFRLDIPIERRRED